jgi:hypothetical protein
MTWALSQSGPLADPAKCPQHGYAGMFCKNGYIIPCETLHGREMCLSFIACTPNEYMPCEIPIPPQVPLPSTGLMLGFALLVLLTLKRSRP